MKHIAHKTRFGSQLAIMIGLGLGLMALITSLVTAVISERLVKESLLEQGRQITQAFADQSVLALLYASAENATAGLDATLRFPSVRGAAVYENTGLQLIARGDLANANGELVKEIATKEVIELEDAWLLQAPVYVANESGEAPFNTNPAVLEQLGYVRVKISKDQLAQSANVIYGVNMGVSAATAIVLLITVLVLARNITRPVTELADTMQKAQSGEKGLRATIAGPSEIMAIEKAFNAMMGTLEKREQELEQARDAALESARVKGEFAANVSHEIRTPLNGVLGMLELLGGMGLTAKQREHLEIARTSGESLLALINDILDFSRIESGGMKIEQYEFAIAPLLDDVLDILGEQARHKELDVAYIIDPDVPETILSDANRLRQVLINLVSNAIKFTHEGEVEIVVGVHADRNGEDCLRIAVRDTGIGISEEAQAHIFDSFAQADGSTTREYGGSGLGLAISRQLVGLLGGTLNVRSTPGQGSLFTVSLPLGEQTCVATPVEASVPVLEGLRLLIVDDNETMRRSLSRFAQYWGMACSVAANGIEAKEKLRTGHNTGRPIDIVLVDKGMPIVSGDALLRSIRSDSDLDALRVVIMTGRDRNGRSEFRMAGASGYLMKPITAPRLKECLIQVAKLDQPSGGIQIASGDHAENYLGCQVLVVEDNRANQKVATGMLERLGCRVELAGNGADALEKASRHRYDLIFMDCQMPVMDGFDATRQIRALEREGEHVPIVALTATVGTEEVGRCKKVGMDDVLGKPIRLDGLKQKLRKWVKHSETVTVEEPVIGAIDPIVFGEARLALGPGLDEIIGVFIEDMPLYLDNIRAAILDHDYVTVTQISHTIKGSASTLGATKLAALSRELEYAARTDQPQGLELILARLTQAFESTQAELNGKLFVAESAITYTQAGEGQRVLVADDDRLIRSALTNVLQASGYRVIEADSGTRVLELVERTVPDLILLDGLMPGMSGFDVCEELRRRNAFEHVPILIVTALEDAQSIERAMNVGATDLIGKPIVFSILKKRIERLLESNRIKLQAQHLAIRDTLTGLANRTTLVERVEATIASTSMGRESALLYVDLDRFKLINDSYGHDTGDLLLKAVADRIMRCVRGNDVVARMGGDEFAILLTEISESNSAGKVARKVLDRFSQPFSFMGTEVYVTPSIGISVCPRDGTDSSTLIKHADTAMYKAKEKGNQYCFYESGMDVAVTKRLELESGLRGAIDREEMVLHYQPQISLLDGSLIGVEALVRWHHPKRGIIPPNDFIPMAEETGLISPLSDWVLSAACKQLRDWMGQGASPFNMAINISGRQLEQPDFGEHVSKIIDNTGVDRRYIELELTESVVMKQAESAVQVLAQLKQAGIGIAIDDFGTGYSSLSYLRRLPIHKLKIDRSFVTDAVENEDDNSIISAIIALAHSLRLRVTAEGVETRAQLKLLKNLECDFAQGYLISEPVTADVFYKQFIESAFRKRQANTDLS